MNTELLENIIKNGKSKEVIGVLKEEIQNGADPTSLINAMIYAMQVVGERFQNGEIMISDMLSSAMTMKKGIKFITPLISDTGAEYIGKAIVGMAAGDLHDIGKGLVSLMLESVGFKVIDLGIDVSPEGFAETVAENPDCKILAVSATLESSIAAVEKTIGYLKKEGLRDRLKIIVGGTAMTRETAEKIGADAFAPTATLSAVIAKELLDSDCGC